MMLIKKKNTRMTLINEKINYTVQKENQQIGSSTTTIGKCSDGMPPGGNEKSLLR